MPALQEPDASALADVAVLTSPAYADAKLKHDRDGGSSTDEKASIASVGGDHEKGSAPVAHGDDIVDAKGAFPLPFPSLTPPPSPPLPPPLPIPPVPFPH